MNDPLASLRIDYGNAAFHASDAGDDPVACFMQWFERAREQGSVTEPNAMALATAASSGAPSCRMVLMKGIEASRAAFGWYTNTESRKGHELDHTRRAALCWWWPGTPERQGRATGAVEQMPRDAVAAYFASRPERSRIGAIASHQSHAVSDRSELDDRVAAVAAQPLKVPAAWGGYWLVADEIEFWQGQTGRLHDRIVFVRVQPDDTPSVTDGIVATAGWDSLLDAGTLVTDSHGARWLRARIAP